MDQLVNKKGLLVVSFGTSYPETRKLTIEAIEDDLKLSFPDRFFLRAWTSGMIRKKVEREEGVHIFSVEEALERFTSDGVTDLLVQPTNLLNGEEMERTRETIMTYRDRFDLIAMGEPLLSGPEDIYQMAKAVEQIYGDLSHDELLALMGHGSASMAFPAYSLLEEQFAKDGFPNICIGTVEFDPGIYPVMKRIRQSHPLRVHLAPLLVVAGDHACRDMAGDSPDSWKNQIAAEGTDAICHVNGLGEYKPIRTLYVEHAMRALVIKGEAAV